MAEYLQIIKSYWWLITGISCLVVWIVNTVFSYLTYRQKEKISKLIAQEYLDRQRNRFFWRWFGIGAAVSLLIHLSSNSRDQVGTDHKLSPDRETDRK